KKITLADVYRFFDGAIALQPCVSQKFHEKCDDCPDEESCDLKPAFYDIREQTYELMSKITIETFLQNRHKIKSRDFVL
ncbi:MAG: Rrf2 family transcriptional regulator, partial [Candidatus Binatia bacterium]